MSATFPLITVTIPTYRRADDLDRCIKSVLAQPGDFFEVLVGDDCSPDHTPQIVQMYSSDPRVRHYRNDHNLGMQENLLKIAKLARGAYVFVLTDDDYLLPNTLTKVAHAVQMHPEAGYVLSHLPTVDKRTGQIVDLHRTFRRDTLIAPGLSNLIRIASSAWVLSRQVLRRDLIDWDTWERFKQNIFFPIIVAGRLVLEAPCFYIADSLVMHTWFNQVYWEAFGRDRLEIEFSLASDRIKCMRAILWDQPPTPEVKRAIAQWKAGNLSSYLYLTHLGFYDLARSMGLRSALRKLENSFELDRSRRWQLYRSLILIPFLRVWYNLKQTVRQWVPLTSRVVRSLRSNSLPRKTGR